MVRLFVIGFFWAFIGIPYVCVKFTAWCIVKMLTGSKRHGHGYHWHHIFHPNIGHGVYTVTKRKH